MIGWLPRLTVRGWTSCESWGEYEGSALSIEWLGRIVEVAVAHREGVRSLRQRAGKAAIATLLTLGTAAWLIVVALFATDAWGAP